jgi:hypothetical protein
MNQEATKTMNKPVPRKQIGSEIIKSSSSRKAKDQGASLLDL